MSYKTITRANAYKIGFGVEAPETLVNPNKLANYTDLSELQCTIKDSGYVHSLAEYSEPIGDKYRTLVATDVIAAGYILSYNMMGHGEQIDSQRVNSIPSRLPSPTAEDYMFNGWYLNSGCTAIAIPGTKLTEDTTIYAKWVESTLKFHIMDASTSAYIGADSISAITINDVVYSGDNLMNCYDTATKFYRFTNFTENIVNYSIIVNNGSTYANLINRQQTFSTLNEKNVILYKSTAVFGELMVSCNWPGTNKDIFDMYTIVYSGQSPSVGEVYSTEYIKLLETSYGSGLHNTHLRVPKNSTDGGFNLYYDTGNDSWCRGETTSIIVDSGKTIEEIFKTYSFVFIINDYDESQPGKTAKAGPSLFAKNASGMTITISVITSDSGLTYVKTISLNEPPGTTEETPYEHANWIIFKTKLLEDDKVLSDMSNLIVEFSRDGYSYFDGNNINQTDTYRIKDGGAGYITT